MNKIISCLAITMCLVACASSKTADPYLIKDYLLELSNRSGLSYETVEQEEYADLINWGVIKEEETDKINEYLDYEYLSITIGRLIGEENDSFNFLKDKGWIKKKTDINDLVTKDVAIEVIEKAVECINNKEFENEFFIETKENVFEVKDYSLNDEELKTKESFNIGDIVFLENDGEYRKIVKKSDGAYIVCEPDYEEIMESIKLQGSYEIDMSEAIDIPGGELVDDTAYINNTREVLASKSNNKTFNTKGFRVSYSVGSSGLNARVSKNIKGINAFFDIAISSIKPTYKWDYSKGKVNEAYFKVQYNSTEEIGVSVGKYKNYYLDFKDKDSSSFMNAIKSIVKTKDDEIEATIKICEIKTPIPNVPTAYFNIDVLARIYTTGKIEVILYNQNVVGLEVKNGQLRMINDAKKDADFSIGGSSKVTAGINFNIEAAKYRLMDIEADVGARAAVSTTLHLYDEEGNMESVSSDMTYSAIDDIAKENENVKVCADVSLNWLLDLKLNTSKTLLSKFGLSRTKSILNERDQILGNKTHVENGVFVSRCTRKEKFKTSKEEKEEINIDKIILDKYSAVINIGEKYSIPIRSIPKGYMRNELVYQSLNNEVASVSNDGVISGQKVGACEIKVSSKDDKYTSSINVLVSSG